MEIVRKGNAPRGPMADSLFTGPDITRHVLSPSSKEFSVSIVDFGKGVRSKFHTHESDQVLIVTAGTGYAATEAETHKVVVGDVIVIPAGEKHWHGAGPESKFSHIAITRPGSKTVLLEG